MKGLEKQQRTYFRDLLRAARLRTLADAEDFASLVFEIEKFGQYLGQPGKPKGLGKLRDPIADVAKASPLCSSIPERFPEYHGSFDSLFHQVKEARNSAVHEGVFARNLVRHAVELSLILEDALMINGKTVADFMVRNPVVAEGWQPLSFIRQTLLANSFSSLPYFNGKTWTLVSDVAVSKHLHAAKSKEERGHRMSETLAKSALELHPTQTADPDARIETLIEDWDGTPICVVGKRTRIELVGILTPYDLL